LQPDIAVAIGKSAAEFYIIIELVENLVADIIGSNPRQPGDIGDIAVSAVYPDNDLIPAGIDNNFVGFIFLRIIALVREDGDNLRLRNTRSDPQRLLR